MPTILNIDAVALRPVPERRALARALPGGRGGHHQLEQGVDVSLPRGAGATVQVGAGAFEDLVGEGRVGVGDRTGQEQCAGHLAEQRDRARPPLTVAEFGGVDDLGEAVEVLRQALGVVGAGGQGQPAGVASTWSDSTGPTKPPGPPVAGRRSPPPRSPDRRRGSARATRPLLRSGGHRNHLPARRPRPRGRARTLHDGRPIAPSARVLAHSSRD